MDPLEPLHLDESVALCVEMVRTCLPSLLLSFFLSILCHPLLHLSVVKERSPAPAPTHFSLNNLSTE